MSSRLMWEAHLMSLNLLFLTVKAPILSIPLMLARAYVMEMFAKLRAWACQENEVLTKDIDKEGWLSEQAKASCHTQTHQSSYKHSSLVIGQEDLITVSCLELVASVAACLPGNRWFDSYHLRSFSYDHTDKT
ncbi:hypothetical protein CTAM01_16478 [Colletotrichum tamarilloi]|uniref:Uncharacterized protein n=1 Tax=Colletotrichum tamarilloi TaxID=1209934 RepID=A0ABQ9QIF8_9PEZI|nr:uncharacterized protein CTAM01_16478 [Colletotrichum tamarilloi]KAK1471737.1 hypothetical protein CTAM01_16478 [Colletotrichum tamarilloi]